ncbi:MAG: winged helix-turn-helix domain-containing protein [Methanobrevibacter sp.]|uniref:winged helix-turn-helix domain-containing protein n=1 Tax=Methanobrevibacter sp. TaxID=66852 RepID=UPI002E7932C0|nr:winged helix-turn-helix domain-containing protein [Methanobrevibacter sp.]MEE0934439.1 winged helix-turn-helix domain-containing protein [Methanobrevibacter sp.]
MVKTNNVQIFHTIRDKELYNLILGTNSAKTRIRILDELLAKPFNANQLAKSLKMDYKTIRYHMEIICKHQYATKERFEKYTFYFPSEKLIKHIDEYIQIKEYYKSQMFEG